MFSAMIPEETIKQLKLYKIANKEYPKRPELIKKFISHRTINKINKVVRTKKIMDNIYSYVDEFTLE